jgi:hypothetical protein
MAKGLLLGLSVSVAFILGCAASTFVVPPARAGSSPQKWEYSCFSDSGAEDVTKQANAMGAQGWELASAAAEPHMGHLPIWCFKRPLS